jgi:transposase
VSEKPDQAQSPLLRRAVGRAETAKTAMDFILDVYRIERAALDTDLLGTPEHLEMRQTRSKAVMDEFKAWLLAQQGRHPPRGPMGETIGYALGNWNALTLFVTDPHLPIDNNASERALRVAALGRKNFLFVGNDEAGENLAGLYSLIATCEVNGVNPVAYLADVLLRVQTHPASRIDDLLPGFRCHLLSVRGDREENLLVLEGEWIPQTRRRRNRCSEPVRNQRFRTPRVHPRHAG